MTAILALYQRNLRPVEPALLELVLAPSRYRARDGESVWVDSHIALAHQHFWVTPEEQGEEQPLVDAAGKTVISFDGRLDNRDTLAGVLGMTDGPGRSVSDAQLVLSAYLRWGETCVEQLLGDFAFVIWDEHAQQLFVARDALGGRDVLYYLDDEICLVGSEASQLLAHPAVEPAINDSQILAYLDSQWDDFEQTVFRRIYHCPPAHGLVISAESVRKRRYWDVDPEASVHYRSDEEYADHFLELLTEAVRGRLRVNGPVGISMSGGMDSPSVAATAAQLLAESGRGPLKSFSYVFPELTECDESAYIEPVVAAFGMDATLIPGDEKWTLKNFERWPIFFDYPGQDYLAWLSLSVLEAAQAAGCRALFTGLYGDDLLTGSVYWAVDVLREGRLLEVLPALLRRRAEVSWRRDLLFNGARLLIPDSLRAVYRRIKRPAPVWRHPGLGPDLQSKQDSGEGQLSNQLRKTFTRPGRWQRYRYLADGSMPIDTALLRQRAIPFGIEYAHPYFDRRLMEFVMAVPSDILGWPLQTKRVLRQAMTGILPESVRQRTVITSLVPLYARGLRDREREVVSRLLEDPLIVQRGYVRESWLRGAWQADTDWERDGFPLWKCISLEMWLNRWWS